MFSGSVSLPEDTSGQVMLPTHGGGGPGPVSTTVQHACSSTHPAIFQNKTLAGQPSAGRGPQALVGSIPGRWPSLL